MRFHRPSQWPAARTVFAAALIAVCGCFEALADLASLDDPTTAEEMETLVEDYSRRLAADPKQAKLYVQRGNAYFRLRDFDLAVEDFDAALRLDANLDEAYFGRGMALGRGGELDRAVADLSIYLQRHPQSSLAYTKRGIRYLWMGDIENAEKDLTQALTLDPKNAEAHDDLGVIRAQRGEYAAAIKHFTATITLDPSYQKAYHNLAMVYYLTNREQRALTVVDDGLKLSPDNRNSLLLKAEILASLGRHKEAKAVREHAEFQPEGGSSERMAIR